MTLDSLETRTILSAGGRRYEIFSLSRLAAAGYDIRRLPYSLRILLENLLRHEDGKAVDRGDIEAVLRWDPKAEPSREIAFHPARVLLQDFTGVPAVVDLAAMRDMLEEMGGDPSRVEPMIPAELVIDHSVQVDAYGEEAAFLINQQFEYERNAERYILLRWGQKAFRGFRVVPPATGIVHQVNLEYLARVVFATDMEPNPTEPAAAYPDTLVGTDSHTTMVNGLGVLAWGVGGIEAEAALLGQPIPLLLPQVVGVRLTGRLPDGATATDLVLTVTERLRKVGVVGRFVEFFGDGLAALTLADRATLSNMAPEFGSTVAIFPVDELTIEYLRMTGRDEARVALVEAYAKEQVLFGAGDDRTEYSEVVEIVLDEVEPSLAGPRRPQDRVPLREAKRRFLEALPSLRPPRAGRDEGGVATKNAARVRIGETETVLEDGAVVLAAITSCTNTSNPTVMLGAGILARKAAARGLAVPPHVKTSLAPGSKVVRRYLEATGLLSDLERLRFHIVGYGCTTCIGNSGPLPEPVAKAVKENDLVVCAVLSGNRNFEGRVNPLTRANYLASPPLVVAYALAGRMDIDFETEPLGEGSDGPVYLRDIWPTAEEIRAGLERISPDMFREEYARVFEGDDRWRSLPVPEGARFAWDDASTYIRRPTFLTGIPREPAPPSDIEGARVLALLGDSVTTDHISPAGSIPADSPAGRYLIERGVAPKDFNSYGARRGNHEVMVRGTFANIRLRNLLVPGVEGGFTRVFPEGETTTIYEAAVRYAERGVPLLVVAGKEYGTGSSRDWAAKGTAMLGVRAVLAESFERIHRSNLVGMGVLPLEFLPGENAASLGLTGEEVFSIRGIAGLEPGGRLTVEADGKRFEVRARVDTPVELQYFRHGGILPFVLRHLAGR